MLDNLAWRENGRGTLDKAEATQLGTKEHEFVPGGCPGSAQLKDAGGWHEMHSPKIASSGTAALQQKNPSSLFHTYGRS